MNKWVRKDLLRFSPYHAPIRPYEIKVDANENPFAYQEEFAVHMQRWIEEKDHITRYPDTDAHELRSAIAKIYHVKSGNVICGVGSDQIIDSIMKVFLEPMDKVLVPNPSFSMYGQSAVLNHGQVVEFELDEEFNYSTELILQRIQEENPKILFLCTPNNPTGNIIKREEIIQILNRVDFPVVVDEAYAEFTKDSVIDLIDTYPNLIVLRTFSKAFGLAGLRTGYAVACEEMIDSIYIAKPPYNLSAYSQEASLFVLSKYNDYMEQTLLLQELRDSFYEELLKIQGIEKVYPSHGNFILIRIKDNKMIDRLSSNRILIRDYPPTGRLANCIRLSVGTKEENERILSVLKEV